VRRRRRREERGCLRAWGYELLRVIIIKGHNMDGSDDGDGLPYQPTPHYLPIDEEGVGDLVLEEVVGETADDKCGGGRGGGPDIKGQGGEGVVLYHIDGKRVVGEDTEVGPL